MSEQMQMMIPVAKYTKYVVEGYTTIFEIRSQRRTAVRPPPHVDDARY
jgi:hypothetical protein